LVTVDEANARQRHWLHFDAKYRLEVTEVETLFTAAEETIAASDDGEEGTAYDQELARIHKAG
jgi:hypothetical protein